MLGNKNSLKHYENSLKRLKTASNYSPRVYIKEGLHCIIGRIFASQIWGACFWEGLIFFYWEGGGGLIIRILRYSRKHHGINSNNISGIAFVETNANTKSDT